MKSPPNLGADPVGSGGRLALADFRAGVDQEPPHGITGGTSRSGYPPARCPPSRPVDDPRCVEL
eukprot:8505569-Heterocapsa_arctica.AAC.1